MKTNLFTKTFKILIVTLLLLTVLFNKNLSQKLMLVAILIWISVMLYVLFGRNLALFLKHCYLHWKSAELQEKIKPFSDSSATEEITQTIPSSEPEPMAQNLTSAIHAKENKRMLQHVSLRITEKLKSAYPDATWQWEEKPNLAEILDGMTFRIATDSMENYTHADVRFDQYARIRITPLIIGEFASTAASGAHSNSEPKESKEPPVVDVISWYDLIGRKVLENIITDLNANGHTQLAVKENGDIIISRNKKETLKGSMEQFPPKNYWKELLQLLEEYELHGKEEKDRIIISWI